MTAIENAGSIGDVVSAFSCNRTRTLIARSDRKGGYAPRCPDCRRVGNLTEGTVFEKSRLSWVQIFSFMFAWVCGVFQKASGKLCGLTAEHTKVDWDVCSWKLENTPALFQFGGPGRTVQIDEKLRLYSDCTPAVLFVPTLYSVFSGCTPSTPTKLLCLPKTRVVDPSVAKRKYNRGQVVPERWVLGIYDCLLKREVVIYVEFRDARTLLAEISRYELPGTTIWTDGWAAYRGLGALQGRNYIHSVANHSENFVDPVTGVCTNAVEAYWSCLKGFCRRNGVLHSALLPSHIDEFMWREVYDQGSVAETWQAYLDHLREKHQPL
ncbi:DEP domain-containing protein [Frankliniella fusca]|uniref:DEP domain-containing protein n=1 Tax=Frankliniella fusca TaxID=407009 RepID=A0AAE1HD86_9NEOP|nr:DEP domain-containing protein [Frankliniella fusca]